MEHKLPKIHVLIVGGGIGGLMLSLMLERAGIDYQILERSPEHRPFGSAISFNSTVLRLFEQLGLLEDLYKISKRAGSLLLVKEDQDTEGRVDLEHFRERYGYNDVVVGRPDLLEMLVRHIPRAKLLMGKRVLSTSQTEHGVLVRCSDSSMYQGDILVGADGAYSSIRQLMHKRLKETGLLPRADSERLKFDQYCVVGITDELSPDKYPVLQKDICELYGVIGKKQPYTMWLIPITGNRFAWSIGGRILDSEVGREDVRSFSFAEWRPEIATDICDLVRDYALPNFKAPFKSGDGYKNSSPMGTHNHDEHPIGDTASFCDNESCHSEVPSEGNISSRASSIFAGFRSTSLIAVARSRASSIWRSSIFSPSNESVNLMQNPQGASTATATKDAVLEHANRYKPLPATPGTVGEIIDATNKDRISKVMLESKMFKVWHHERTVLLGDACHKLLPFDGQGASQAILDGISLANALYDMKTSSIEDITKAFKRYANERIPVARDAVARSHSFGKLFNINSRLSDLVRKLSFTRVPAWILKLATGKQLLHRPQLAYLPMAPDHGSAKAYRQEYSPRYLTQLAREKQAARDKPKKTPKDYSRKKSSRSAAPPPLPLKAPPRHHPTVYMDYQPDTRKNYPSLPSPSFSVSFSQYSSSASSLYSLASSQGVDDLSYHQSSLSLTPRTICHSDVSSGNRSRSVSSPIKFLDDTGSTLHSSNRIYNSQALPPLPQDSASSRSPMVATQPRTHDRKANHTVPAPSQYPLPHKRTKSLQHEHSLAREILALEQTTAMMKERVRLREQRSWDQIRNVSMSTMTGAAALPPRPPVINQGGHQRPQQ
ncbi:hypothetical protein BGZ99_009020 [Dissophora globulifera]|uniref:FAD-binding domain-containing protein n=1 Tax=Dissophora globulifera TaxID=979702 RepID=A0A9P6R5Q3_9FUNG|nr:hypothetical protein BGZ99_009020 [Dissophora globulifera]